MDARCPPAFVAPRGGRVRRPAQSHSGGVRRRKAGGV